MGLNYIYRKLQISLLISLLDLFMTSPASYIVFHCFQTKPPSWMHFIVVLSKLKITRLLPFHYKPHSPHVAKMLRLTLSRLGVWQTPTSVAAVIVPVRGAKKGGPSSSTTVSQSSEELKYPRENNRELVTRICNVSSWALIISRIRDLIIFEWTLVLQYPTKELFLN